LYPASSLKKAGHLSSTQEDPLSTQLGNFSIQFERDGGTVVVRIAGDLDLTTAPELEHGLTSLIDGQGNLSIRVELGRVTFIDATGLTALGRAQRQAHDRGGELALANPTPQILRVLDMVGLTPLLCVPAGATTPPVAGP